MQWNWQLTDWPRFSWDQARLAQAESHFLRAGGVFLGSVKHLAWFADTAVEAQRLAVERAEFLINKARLLDRLRGQLNQRQEKALIRIMREGPEGFAGGLSAGNYATITGASPATVTRDLSDMVAMGALERRGNCVTPATIL